MNITAAHLRKIANGSAPLADRLVGPINKYAAEYRINTLTLLACWLGHMCHETTGFSRLEENLNYTTAERLMKVWPARFKTMSSATPYLRNPRKLANKVYGGRLGNTGSDDGWLYRGSGAFQTTGKENFLAVKVATGLDVVAHPEWLREPDMAVRAAAIYFNSRVRSVAASIEKSTYAINGGQIGLAERRAMINRAKSVLPSALAGDEFSPEVEPKAIGGEPIVDYTLFQRGKVYDALKVVQGLLIDRGYVGVGGVDGKFGSMTRNTWNAFRADNGLDPDMNGADVDETIALLRAAAPRELPERSVATVETVARKSEIVQTAQAVQSDASKAGWYQVGAAAVSAAIGGGAATTATDNGGAATVQQTAENARWLREYFPAIPLWAWLVLAILCALVIPKLIATWQARKAKRIVDLRVDEYRKGGVA